MCVRIFRQTSLALISLEKVIISQWPVYKSGKETFIHCGSQFISPEVWGCLGGHDEERRKRSFQILRTNHRTILCQIKPQASLWLLSVQRSSTWLPGDWSRICLFSAVIHVCVMGDTQRIKMSRQAKNMSDSDVCYSSAVTFFFFLNNNNNNKFKLPKLQYVHSPGSMSNSIYYLISCC